MNGIFSMLHTIENLLEDFKITQGLLQAVMYFMSHWRSCKPTVDKTTQRRISLRQLNAVFPWIVTPKVCSGVWGSCLGIKHESTVKQSRTTSQTKYGNTL